MKARIWFHALVQRHEGFVSYHHLKVVFGYSAWPAWAQDAYMQGRSNGSHVSLRAARRVARDSRQRVPGTPAGQGGGR